MSPPKKKNEKHVTASRYKKNNKIQKLILKTSKQTTKDIIVKVI
jgi:hypothetical protein